MYEQESEKPNTKTTPETTSETTSEITSTGKIKNINDSLYYQVKFSEDLWANVVVPKSKK